MLLLLKPLLNTFVSTGVKSETLTQPDSVTVQPGHTLISCRVSGYSLTDNSYATGWIRQRQGKLEWIFHQWGSGSGSFYQNNALKDRFSFSRDMSAGTVTIQGQRLQPDDSAVYYCVRPQ
uniref:Ig-like domain-containing protein n=1 Tax=Neogobius melanostomus TaxID=47308 RepID=A0A8C6V082_9GOBI